MGHVPALLVLGQVVSACSLSANISTWLDRNFQVPPPPLKKEVTLKRDIYGIAHITAPTLYGAGYGVGLAQVEEFGLDLHLYWAMLDTHRTEVLDQQFFTRMRWGMAPGTIQFDSRGFPKPSAQRHAWPPTIAEIQQTYDYLGFDQWIADAEAQLPSDLREYLQGYVAGVNAKMAELRPQWESSSDPRIQYMVSRGLHTRLAKVRDPIAAFTKLTADFAIGAYNGWADAISIIPPSQASAKKKSTGRALASVHKEIAPAFYFTASNETGISGTVTASGRPMLVLDGHQPTHTEWWNRNSSMVIRTPQLILDGGIGPGNALPTAGQALHPLTQTAMGFTGTANAITPVNVWFAETQSDLSSYRSYKTGDQWVAFQTENRGGIPVRTGSHGRLIGYEPTRGYGFMIRQSKDGNFTMIEGLWAMFHSRNPAEFRAALNLHKVPFWHMTVGFSTQTEPSRLLYISNQVTAVRDPDPNQSTAMTDWNDFMPAWSEAHDWLPQYHLAADLPQREVSSDPGQPAFVHCHNCSPEQVTGQPVTRPYLQGGYADVWNHRQMLGNVVYAENYVVGHNLTLDQIVPVINDKRDMQLTDLVTKMNATFAQYGSSLEPNIRAQVQQELAIWNSGPVDGDRNNTRVGRVLFFQLLMKTVPRTGMSLDIDRLIFDLVLPGTRELFDASQPLAPIDAGAAFDKMVQVHLTYDSLFGGPNKPWGEIQMIRPGFGDFLVPGTPNGLMSIAGPLATRNGLSIFEVVGGQNYVMAMEIGLRSLLRRSVHGTYDTTLPYAARFTELYSAEAFVPTGLREVEWTEGRLLSSETRNYSP